MSTPENDLREYLGKLDTATAYDSLIESEVEYFRSNYIKEASTYEEDTDELIKYIKIAPIEDFLKVDEDGDVVEARDFMQHACLAGATS